LALLSVHIFSEILYGKNETGKIYIHTFFSQERSTATVAARESIATVITARYRK
jgi:hypothetical protein